MTDSLNGSVPTARTDTTTTDEQLMLELADGRPDALGALYSRHSRLVFYLALQSLDRAAAEELVQEVFLAIWRGAGAFDPDQGGSTVASSTPPWMHCHPNSAKRSHWHFLRT